MPNFLTEYTHIDGTQWAGPTLTADSLDEARAAAMDYPMQPLEVLGELVEVVDAGPDTRKGKAN
jgi:hypothetical protein